MQGAVAKSGNEDAPPQLGGEDLEEGAVGCAVRYVGRRQVMALARLAGTSSHSRGTGEMGRTVMIFYDCDVWWVSRSELFPIRGNWREFFWTLLHTYLQGCVGSSPPSEVLGQKR